MDYREKLKRIIAKHRNSETGEITSNSALFFWKKEIIGAFPATNFWTSAL
jgi:hypothetical protein